MKLGQKLVYSLCFFTLIIGSNACSNKLHFDYEPNEYSQVSETIQRGDLKIAVMAFEDARPNINSGNVNYALIPLIPTWGQTKSDHQGKRAKEVADYYYPGLLTYSIARDLEHNKIASVIHIDPALNDQYDLIVRGKLTKLEFGARKITYGLSYLGYLLQMVMLPTGWVSVYSESEVEVYSPYLSEPIYKGVVKGDWGNLTYSGNENNFFNEVALAMGSRRKIHGVVDAFSESSESLVEKILPDIHVLASRVNNKMRLEAYYAKLDPEILDLVADPGNANTLRRRITALEKYRQKEFTRLVQEDQIKRDILNKRLAAIKARRNQVVKYKLEAIRVENERKKIEKQQMRAVVDGVVRGMATRNQSGYYTQEENLQAALQDFATGAQHIQPINVPAFPAAQLISQLDRNLPGLPAVGNDPFAAQGKRTLPEIRARFLERYRRRF